MNKIFTLSWTNVKSALITALLTAVLAMGAYVLGIGDIFKIDWKAITNIGVLSLITAIVSIIKSLLTTDKGKFLGAVKVTEEK